MKNSANTLIARSGAFFAVHGRLVCRPTAIFSASALQTLQALHVEEAVGLGSASCYSALAAPHGSDAVEDLVECLAVLREEG